MNRLLLCLVAAALGVARASALESPEAMQAQAGIAFHAASGPRPALRPSLRVLQSGGPAAPAAKATRLLRLQGHVFLNGTAMTQPGNPWVSVTVAGWTNLQDLSTGRMLQGTIRVSDTQNYSLNGGNFVSGWARPYAYVTITDGGRRLGTMRVEGSIFVSGFDNGGWLRLSGNGYVFGQMMITEDDPPAKP